MYINKCPNVVFVFCFFFCLSSPALQIAHPFHIFFSVFVHIRLEINLVVFLSNVYTPFCSCWPTDNIKNHFLSFKKKQKKWSGAYSLNLFIRLRWEPNGEHLSDFPSLENKRGFPSPSIDPSFYQVLLDAAPAVSYK